MKLEWDKIVSNAVSTIVTMIVVGAGVIIWKGATTVDDKVNDATAVLKEQADYMQKAVEVIQSEMVTMKNQQNHIIQLLNGRTNKTDVAYSKKLLPMVEPLPETPPDFIQQRLPERRELERVSKR